MIELEYPWLMILLPLPYFIYLWAPSYKTTQQALSVPFFKRLVNGLNLRATKGAASLRASRWQRVSIIATWLMLVIAIAKPMWLDTPKTYQLSGRDLMLVVDLSGSMSERDFLDNSGKEQDRLTAAKSVLETFAAKREGDRLGLILFGDSAYLQSPFTADHEAWLALLDQAQVGMAGESTHLGDAVGLTIKTYIDNPENQTVEKVAIILTDGNDTDSLVPPIDAAKVAQAYGIRLYIVAMGSPNTTGDQAIDFSTIETMATVTGGQAFLAMSQEDLDAVYQTISVLEPKEYQSFTYQPKTSLHFVPVLLGVLNHLMFMLYRLMFQTKVFRFRVKAQPKREL
ncbi:VWA domain-containing protein [Vibrio sp. McD22-P3]|uniref:VWA domain-containing protein n=1 Tax=Vibrio sp. McD22-P3 TaxID=2724880 RepID=UPI001F1AA4C1|nr:VWA domain-containing protein [Vibrio sp. McD22-P3]MCF4174236.1 VWA domain-containing protein [Vibrio sp. McD22-P3]